MKAILGTMNIGQQVFLEDALAMFDTFTISGGVEVDTAYVYNDGKCERIIGECLSNFNVDTFKVATKVNPRITNRLDYNAVKNQLSESLSRLRLESLDVLYFHFPDGDTPIEEPIRAAAEAYTEGKFKELGVSNFPLSLVEEMFPICDELGCPKPTVFEGVYNALSRSAEKELFPELDRLGMRFYAYNPLAGGMLTGKYLDIHDKPSNGRFALRAKSYQGRYWKESYFKAVKTINEACRHFKIPVAEAAYRWLSNHSMLNDLRGDGVIIGASCMSQLKQNLSSLAGEPLPDEVLQAIDEAWKLTAGEAPEYYRFYSGEKEI